MKPLALIALMLLVTGCSLAGSMATEGALFVWRKTPALAPRVVESPTHCEVAKSAGRPCLEPAAANTQEPI